ncbi:uncharacterized protein K460DRAFT_356106 [Cucurbitaria berberidis CBS 394.84]|uniref:RING-type domain-containing protein n=1 Tax=Cucurbitaria berberidis CBS 394.84 TaxID=1168544 RepID=A0A9P4GJM8_9PLEO|nr:uncharacterized protein K460DRAFT_356106 [Cucurbitaria berberidis CBS 394.84]KAF1846429.1 hypothetical protein K460DRAFT_356106 [Cucurbitaria berberidis CBS 394.84]
MSNEESTEEPEIKIEFTNPTCIIWGVLALARLHEHLPSGEEAARLYNINGFPWAYEVHNALTNIIFAFADPDETSVWGTLYPGEGDAMLYNLKEMTNEYYQRLNNAEAIAGEFVYLYSIFWAFHHRITLELPQGIDDEYGPVGMMNAVNTTLSNSLANTMENMLEALRPLWIEDASPEAFANFEREHIDRICAAIELVIQDQAALELDGDFDVGGHVGRMFARMIHVPLRRHIEGYFHDSIQYIGMRIGYGSHTNNAGIKDEIDALVRDIARFFSYASPLLSTYWPDDVSVVRDSDEEEGDEEEGDEDEGDGDEVMFQPDPENALPEHVVNHNFEEYEEEDWYWEQYEVNTLVDVLDGPANVRVDQVSTVVPAADVSSCGICGDTKSTMRNINVCSHEFCEDCLEQQLSTYHNMRYRCAACRAEFFPKDVD